MKKSGTYNKISSDNDLMNASKTEDISKIKPSHQSHEEEEIK